MARKPKRATSSTGSIEVFVVRGQIRFADGTPVKEAIVEAYDQDLRFSERLGKPALTGSDGCYDIAYTANQFARAEKGAADLLVSVRRNSEEPIWSDILFNAPAEAVVDLVMPRGPRDPSEFDLVYAAIPPLLQGQGPKHEDLPLWALESGDVTFLASETGLNRQRIDSLVQGFKLAHTPESDGIPPAVFYGWFRLGVPEDPTGLWATPTADLLAVLQTALAQRIVPSELGKQVDTIQAAIEGIKHDRALNAPAPGTATNAKLGDLLATLAEPLSADDERAIAAGAPGLRPDDRQLADKIARLPGFKGDAPAVARTLWLGALTGGYVPLVRALQDPAVLGGPAAASAFDLRPFARLEAGDWKEILQRPQQDGTPIGAPGGTPGVTEEDRLNNYAAALVQFVEKTLPTPVIASRLAADGAVDSPFLPAKADLTTFFDNNPDFELGATPMALYLQDGRNEKLANVADPSTLVASVDDLSRVFKLTRATRTSVR